MLGPEAGLTNHGIDFRAIRAIPAISPYPHPQGFESRETRPRSLDELVGYLDRNWRNEGFSKPDWWNFDADFNIDRQLNLRQKMPPLQWVDVTRKEFQAHTLEYPWQGLVFPYSYRQKTNAHGQIELIDTLYNRDVTTLIDPAERNGSVLAAVRAIKAFHLSPETPEGSISIITSPLGPIDIMIKDEDGEIKEASYEDSQFLIAQKIGKEVKGTSVKTGLTLEQCAALLKMLVGVDLAEDALIEDYVRAVALIKPGHGINSARDVVDILRIVRRDVGDDPSEFVFEERSWEEVYADLEKREDLYDFGAEVKRFLDEFEKSALTTNHSDFVMRKLLAATLLRISKHFVEARIDRAQVAFVPKYYREEQPSMDISFGQAREEAESLSGCGAGGTSSILSGVPRLVVFNVETDAQLETAKLKDCLKCGENAGDKHYHCNGCGRKYANETETPPSLRTKQCSCGNKFHC